MSNFDSVKKLKEAGLVKESIKGTVINPPIAPVTKKQILPYATVNCDEEAYNQIRLGAKMSLVFYGRTRVMCVYRKRKLKSGYRIYVKPYLKN